MTEEDKITLITYADALEFMVGEALELADDSYDRMIMIGTEDASALAEFLRKLTNDDLGFLDDFEATMVRMDIPLSPEDYEAMYEIDPPEPTEAAIANAKRFTKRVVTSD